MFFVLGISISVFLEFLLLIKKEKSRADKVLMIWLLLLFVHQVYHYQQYTGLLYEYPHLLGWDFSLPILHGVLLYFYVLEITGNSSRNVWKIMAHLIPALSLILLAIPFYLLPGEEKIWVLKNGGEGYEWYVIYQKVLIFISGILYSSWSLFLIKKHRLTIQQNFSNTEKKELQWLQYLSILLGLIWFLVLFFDSNIIFTAVVIFVLFIGFFGINQMSIFYPSQELEKASYEKNEPLAVANKAAPVSTKRYAKSGLNEATAEELYANLKELMANELLFKKNDLTLTELAKRLNVHSNYLSQVINEKEQKNFYNYINALRIREFIRLASLSENKKYTLLSLAYDCGFNSKSTFNKHFKENTQKTPTEYFKSQITD